MFGFGRPAEVAEHEARGEIERVYHQIRQTLRVTGVNLNFRTWANFEMFLPKMWDAVRPNAETRAFEDAADRVREQAVSAAAQLGRLDVISEAKLGESQAYQIRRALELYHYINPKLLVLTSAVHLAIRGELTGPAGGAMRDVELIERGAPAKMYPMEMTSADPDDQQIADLFKDIRRTLSLSSVNSDYRTLALWPEYLIPAWARLKPVVTGDDYLRAADGLRDIARSLARSLPYPVPLSRGTIERLGENVEKIIIQTQQFEQLLPGLILNVSLLALDWQGTDALRQSPFPAPTQRQA